MIKVCPICGKEFETDTNKRYCSKKCSIQNKREYWKAWKMGETEMYKCKLEHNNCFSCPTLDGECLFD